MTFSRYDTNMSSMYCHCGYNCTPFSSSSSSSFSRNPSQPSSSSSSSPPQTQILIRTPPGFPPANAIQAPPPQPTSRRYQILLLESWRNDAITTFLLADAQTGHLFHGTLACRKIWLEQYVLNGLDVQDFRVGNKRIIPVLSSYIFHDLEEESGWLRYVPSPYSFSRNKVEIKRQPVLQYREFAYRSDGAAKRLRNQIEVCERVRRVSCPYLAEYKGVEVDRWDRVMTIAFKRYTSNLLDFSLDYHLRSHHVLRIKLAIGLAIRHLRHLGFSYGLIKPENIYLTYLPIYGDKVLREVVLGDFDQAVIGIGKVTRSEEVVMGVERKDVNRLGQVIKTEEEEVWETKSELWAGVEWDSLDKLEEWMLRALEK